MVKLNKQLKEVAQDLHDKCWAIDPEKCTKAELKLLLMEVAGCFLKAAKKMKQVQSMEKSRIIV